MLAYKVEVGVSGVEITTVDEVDAESEYGNKTARLMEIHNAVTCGILTGMRGWLSPQSWREKALKH